MEETFRTYASYAALGVEIATVVTVALGAAEAIFYLAAHFISDRYHAWSRRAIWLRFATWILLSLEFAQGADIIRTAIAPSWDDIGKLAAIAAIRTLLNFFLSRDIADARDMGETTAEPMNTPAGARG